MILFTHTENFARYPQRCISSGSFSFAKIAPSGQSAQADQRRRLSRIQWVLEDVHCQLGRHFEYSVAALKKSTGAAPGDSYAQGAPLRCTLPTHRWRSPSVKRGHISNFNHKSSQVGLWQGFRGVTPFRASDGQPGSYTAERSLRIVWNRAASPMTGNIGLKHIPEVRP
jgi:hypothetical protein